jgi:hypothetical protein
LIRRGHELVGYFVVTYGFDLEFGGRQATSPSSTFARRHDAAALARPPSATSKSTSASSGSPPTSFRSSGTMPRRARSTPV